MNDLNPNQRTILEMLVHEHWDKPFTVTQGCCWREQKYTVHSWLGIEDTYHHSVLVPHQTRGALLRKGYLENVPRPGFPDLAGTSRLTVKALRGVEYNHNHPARVALASWKRNEEERLEGIYKKGAIEKQR